MKIVVNKCYGGFGLSTEAVKWLIKNKSSLITKKPYSEYSNGIRSIFDSKYSTNEFVSVGDGFFTDGFLENVLYDEKGENVWFDNARSYEFRSHPDLISVIEVLGSEVASGKLARLEIVDIPDGVEYEIHDYDGIESIHESHRSW